MSFKTETGISIELPFQAVWETLGFNSNMLNMDHEATISPQRMAGDLADKSLPQLSISDIGESKPDLEKKQVLGEGGMGIVYLASQRSLQREVAVKMIRSGQAGILTEATKKLVHEARATGVLEHPNIVPVHLLGEDEKKLPLLVMKRIEGASWRAILREEVDSSDYMSEAKEPLVWHVEVLMRVCRAIQFAHSRKILHRDIKPENVMIGRFGEVYVLDWGLAVSLDPNDKDFLPLAERAKGVAGTPAYMSPEMTTGIGTLLSEATDVYLLGATLYEILTGKPPHFGETLYEVLFCAYQSKIIPFPEGTSPELGNICIRALANKPSDRYSSVEDLRQDLSDFLLHRNSEFISVEAISRLKSLRELLHSKKEDIQSVNLEVHELYGQCRFGFQEALRSWKENEQALIGLQETLELMAEFQMEQGEYAAAAALLAQFPHPNYELEKRLEQLNRLLDDEQKEREELEKIKKAVDLKIGARVRSIFIFLVGLCWGGFFFTMGWLYRTQQYEATNFDYVTANLGIGFLLGIAIFLRRDILLENAANQRLVQLVFLSFGSFALLGVVGWRLNIKPLMIYIIALIIIFLIMSVLTIFIDWRLIGASIIFLLALFACLWKPLYSFEFQGAADMLAFAWVAFVWDKWTSQLI